MKKKIVVVAIAVAIIGVVSTLAKRTRENP